MFGLQRKVSTAAFKIVVNNKDVLLKTVDFLFRISRSLNEDVLNNYDNDLSSNAMIKSHTSSMTLEKELCVTEDLNFKLPLIKENKFPALIFN